MDPPIYGRYNSCRRKKAYSEKRARANVVSLMINGEENVHAYKCEHCPSWHVGHQERKDK